MLFHPSGDVPTRLLCFGASGMATQIMHDLRSHALAGVTELGYVADVADERRRVEQGARIYSFEELLDLEDVGVIVTVHHPAGRMSVYERLTERGIPIIGSRGVAQLVHPEATLGEGSFVNSTTRLGHTTVFGRGVIGMADCVAHDVEVGDFTTLAYGCVVAGHVQIGRGVFVGARAVIQNGTVDRDLVIGDGAVIGAGAVVTSDVAPGETVVGPRAMPLSWWRALLAGQRP